MNAPTLDDIVKQLEDEKTKSAARASQLRNALTLVEDQVARLDGAIWTLRGKPHAAPHVSASRKSSEKRKAAAPAASRAQVAEFMTTTLQKNGLMQEEKLKIAVENQLVGAGFSRMGYALRFNEALTDARFVKGEEGVTLRRRAGDATSSEENRVAGDMPLQIGHPGNSPITLHT